MPLLSVRKEEEEGKKEGAFFPFAMFMFSLELKAYKAPDELQQVSRPRGLQDPLRRDDNISGVHSCHSECFAKLT